MKISLFSFLQVLVVLFETAFIFAFYNTDPVSCIDGDSIPLSLVLSFVVLLQLQDGKKNSNSLLLILGYWLCFYVIFRFFSFQYTGFSPLLNSVNASASDYNSTLVVTIISTIVMWAGLHYNKKVSRTFKENIDDTEKVNINRALLFFWVSLFINIIARSELPGIGGIANILSMYCLYSNAVFYVFCIIVMCYWGKLESKNKILSIISLLAFAVFLTMGGSRAGLIVILRALFFVLLALGFMHIRIKYIIVAVAIAPLLVFLFTYSTYLRGVNAAKEGSSREKIELISTVYANSGDLDFKTIMSPVFERIGFFDFTLVCVKKDVESREVVNLSTEVKSIIDNALTPGFDLFNQPRVSLAISPWLNGHTRMKKSQVSDEDYLSSEFTLYGESYVLFGIPIFILFTFLIAFIFRCLWVKFSKKNNLISFAYKALLLYYLDFVLSSYGLDWIVFDFICMIITLSIFTWFVFGKKNDSLLL